MNAPEEVGREPPGGTTLTVSRLEVIQAMPRRATTKGVATSSRKETPQDPPAPPRDPKNAQNVAKALRSSSLDPQEVATPLVVPPLSTA